MLKEKIRAVSTQYHAETVADRRHIHQHPELSFQEFETCRYLKQRLNDMNIEAKVIGNTGLVATLQGKEPNSRIRALRADIDALPIQELNETAYRSKNDGVMHACGHDVHSSSLLGVARILQETKEDWKGSIKLIFQPGEEQLPGGASILIQENVLKNPAPLHILGQHVEPLMEVGKVGIKSGMFMASADEIRVRVKGKGGHAAKPHLCVDSVLMAAQLIVQLQQIVSRNANPLTPTVLSFGKIFSEGGATNILPDEVVIHGTLRTYDESWRKRAHQLLKENARMICRSMGGDCDFDIAVGYPFLKNDEQLTAQVKASMIEFLGPENVLELPAIMGAEDFAYYTQEIPGCFYRLGVQNPNQTGLHTPQFDIDEKALETSVATMSWLAVQEF